MLTQALSDVGIGASEIASACGLSRYRSRFGLWLEKTGRRPSFAGNLATRLGQLLEPRARQLYADATGHSVWIPPASMFHGSVKWARATPDGIVEPRATSRHGMQIKCVGYFVGKRMRYEVPIEYEAQVQWEMFVAELDRNDLAVLVGSDELEWERFIFGEAVEPQELVSRMMLDIHVVNRSEAAIAALLDGARAFMELVWSDTQPPVDDSLDATHYYQERARKNRPQLTIDESEVAGDLVAQYRDAFIASKMSSTSIDLAKNRIREAMDRAGANRIKTKDGPIDLRIDKRGTVSLHAPRAWGSQEEI